MTLKEAREAKGYSQEYFASRINVTQSAVSLWEKGKIQPLRKYYKPICRVLGVKEHEITELSKPRKIRKNANV